MCSQCISLYDRLVADGFDPPDATMYSCLLSASVESGELDRASHFFHKVRRRGRREEGLVFGFWFLVFGFWVG